MRARELLGERGAAAVEAAVRGAERATSGEIVPIVVAASDGYWAARACAGALAAFAAGGALALFAPAWLHWLVPAQLAVFAAIAWLAGRAPLVRALVPGTLRDEAVESAAALAFHAAGLVETRERTGILIFVSLAEHRVIVLADRGIHARVPEGTWDEVVAQIVAGIRDGRAEQGLADGIRRCGEILAQRFPRASDDTNELPDAPR